MPPNNQTMKRQVLFGTVFQTAAHYAVIIPRLRPGLLSLRSVLSSRQAKQKQRFVRKNTGKREKLSVLRHTFLHFGRIMIKGRT